MRKRPWSPAPRTIRAPSPRSTDATSTRSTATATAGSAAARRPRTRPASSSPARWRRLPGCRAESFRAWLFAIAHNVIANDLRDRRPAWPIDHAVEVADPAIGPEQAALAAEAGATVREVLALLPDEQRRVLELRLAGLSGPEIARALGRSHGSVRVAQFRAISRLRALLAEPPDAETTDG